MFCERQSSPWRCVCDLTILMQPYQQARSNPTTSNPRRSSLPAGNVDGEWTHDLHTTVNGGAGGPLSSRVSLPGANGNNAAARRAASKKAVRWSAAIDRMEVDESLQEQVNVVRPKPVARDSGISIRGLAGPFSVLGQNFAPGTTAADVESAMTPIGGEMVICKVIKTQPFMVIEMVFSSREGGQRVIETFDNKTASLLLTPLTPLFFSNATSRSSINTHPGRR